MAGTAEVGTVAAMEGEGTEVAMRVEVIRTRFQVHRSIRGSNRAEVEEVVSYQAVEAEAVSNRAAEAACILSCQAEVEEAVIFQFCLRPVIQVIPVTTVPDIQVTQAIIPRITDTIRRLSVITMAGAVGVGVAAGGSAIGGRSTTTSQKFRSMRARGRLTARL